MVQPVPEYINFPKEEENIINLWNTLDAFKNCLKQSKSKPKYTFYDGPPFATGLPHYGHLLAGTVKDVVTRFAHQSGYHVERRFGWDCHGLPVEYEIDKTLNIKGPEDIQKMGIENYNNECRKIVMRYADEWENIVTRLGRWIDFKNDYKTLYPWFMESIWWVFKQLYDKGLVYKGFKVMPFSTACHTPLSNFESGQNYKDVTDPAIIVSFPLDENPEISLLAWTTTPWTLPSNLSICVHPDLNYVKIHDKNTQKIYIIMEARIGALFKSEESYEILETVKGSSLRGKKYKPLFPYFQHLKNKGAFVVLTDDYVTEESGTGVVHQAPYFGEEDFRICLANGVIKRDQDIVCPVDESGCFTSEVTDFIHQYVKDADKYIIKWLKENNRLVHQGTVVHSYPFCWRSDTPLLYKAVPSWFVRVEQLVYRLLKNNQITNWVPEFVKDKRFANWLRDAKDWTISRNRYWGTPIPLWISDDGEEIVCIGSIEELEKMTGLTVKDLHRETIDNLTIPSKRNKGMLKRISEVFDCWFESGSMPYAQVHYPFENKKEFEENFPADFVAEGIDQTRGWFYTLLVLSTALFDRPPFKNLIAHGLVLASDGQKMSKRKKNYPDPMDIIFKYGSDALRLYLINSPVVRGDNLRFKEEGVKDILKDVFLPWYNAYRFLIQNILGLEKEKNVKFVYDKVKAEQSTNIMDKWILSFNQSLIKYVKQEMQAYRLYTVLPLLVKFVDKLTNWYVRSNRKRLKGDGGLDDCLSALNTLFTVLFSMVRIMSPITPFLTEYIYQNLRHLIPDSCGEKQDNNSVHYLMFPDSQDSLIDIEIEVAVSRMQSVIELGRIIRDRKTLPIKYPLPEIVVIHKDEKCLSDIILLKDYILEELNIKIVTTSIDKEKYGVRLRAEPDHKILGARLKSDFKGVAKEIKELSDEQLRKFVETGEIIINGHKLNNEDLRIMYSFDGETAKSLSQNYEAHADNSLLVLLNVTPNQSMLDEGIAREIINRIQKLRKKAHLVPSDDVTIFYDIHPPTDNLKHIAETHEEYIENALKQPLRKYPVPKDKVIVIEENIDLKGVELHVTISKGHLGESIMTKEIEEIPKIIPFCRFVNVELRDNIQNRIMGSFGTVLLENPRGNYHLSVPQLFHQIKIIFGLQEKSLKLYYKPDRKDELFINSTLDLYTLHGRTLYAYPQS